MKGSAWAISIAIDLQSGARHMPPVTTIVAAVVVDNRLVCDALTARLNALPHVRAASSAVPDQTFLVETSANVMLLDAWLRDQDSLSLAIAVKHVAPNTKIIVMDLVLLHKEIGSLTAWH